MWILCFLLFASTFAYDDSTSVINIHEELPPNILLLPTISSSNLQWLPSSYSFQPYFNLRSDQSLYTTVQVIDREKFCEQKLCNCSKCSINLSFLQTNSPSNISIRTIEIIIEGNSLFVFCSFSFCLFQISMIIHRHSNNQLFDFRLRKMFLLVMKFL